MTAPETIQEINRLLALPRCQTVTQDSNIQLANAVDAALQATNSLPEALNRLQMAITADREEHPYQWPQAWRTLASTPIIDAASADALFAALAADGKLYHPEESAHHIVLPGTWRNVFTPQEADNLDARMLDIAEFADACDFAVKYIPNL